LKFLENLDRGSFSLDFDHYQLFGGGRDLQAKAILVRLNDLNFLKNKIKYFYPIGISGMKVRQKFRIGFPANFVELRSRP
jgi:hypothetical protein